MLEWFRFVCTASLMVSGLFVLVTAMLGQFRLHYALNRMHAAGMGESLGLGLCCLSLVISGNELFICLKLLLCVFFLFITSPTATHLVALLEYTDNSHPETEMEMIRR